METIDSHDDNIPKTRDAIVKILEQTIEGIAIIGEDMRIEYINDRVCEILGWTRGEILGQPLLKFIHPDNSELIVKRFASRIAGEDIRSTYKTRVLRSNSEPRDLEVRTAFLHRYEILPRSV
jgi:PAS domain S-box-containing protein